MKEKERITHRFVRRSSRELTPEEAREISRLDAIASRDPKNWRTYEIEDTGRGGSLRVRIPSAFHPNS